MDTVVRRTGRVLPVHRGRVLLLHGGDPARPEAGEWWFTVGGGCEPGESSAGAARREALEEAGLVLPDDLGPVVLQRETRFEFDGVWLEQTEDYYLCEVGSDAVDPSGRTDLERRVLSDQRWWSVDELEATSELVYPEGLASIMTRYAGSDRPPR